MRLRVGIFGADAHGWAVWCSIDDRSFIVIFRENQPDPSALLSPVLVGRPGAKYREAGYPSCSGYIGRAAATEISAVLAGKLVDLPDGPLTAEERAAVMWLLPKFSAERVGELKVQLLAMTPHDAAMWIRDNLEVLRAEVAS